MSLEITAAHSLTRSVPEVLNTTHLRITGVFFDFNEESAKFIVGYGIGTGESFVQAYQETWSLSGNPLRTIMLMDAAGTTRFDSLKDMMSDIASRVQNNPALKQQLIDSGDLSISVRPLFS